MELISDGDIVARMRFDNPWWITGETPFFYANLPKRDFYPTFQKLVTMREPHRSVVLMGPRRVGKTVMIFQSIHDLSKSNPDVAKHILFVSLDTPAYKELPLEKLLHLFMNIHGHDSNVGLTVFFDEVQYSQNWENQLKSLTDSYRQLKFVVSGSAVSLTNSNARESGAGRFTDFTLRPLTFAEHLRLNGLEELHIVIKDNSVFAKDIHALNAEFERYINFGGYPEVSLSSNVQSDVERFLRADILDRVMLRDLLPIYGISDAQELDRLFRYLAFETGREVTLEKLSHNSGVSKNTVIKYLEFLEHAELVTRLERVDLNARSFKRPGGTKIYLANPSLRTAMFGPVHRDEDGFGLLVETAILAQHLHDTNFRRLARFARWDSGEVDFITLDPALQRPWAAVEYKWSDNMLKKPEELRSLVAFARTNGLVKPPIVTTKTIHQNNFLIDGYAIWLRPAATYCYSIGKDLSDHWVVGCGYQSPFPFPPTLN
jgi:uncharacterized protein